MMKTNIAEGLSLPETTAAHEERKAYGLDDIKRVVVNLPRKPDEPEKYWIPMMAMYSGLRLDECCQMHVLDVKLVDDILCFDVNDVGDRKVKTQSSKRLVPVHPKLLKLGFGEFLEGRSSVGSVKLWENLEPNKYGYWGKNFGKWYGKFNRKYITDDPRKVFHSLRHTVADTLKQAGVETSVISELLGHSHDKGNMTLSRYGKRYRPKVLLDALMKLDYGFEK
jgi:integrase